MRGLLRVFSQTTAILDGVGSLPALRCSSMYIISVAPSSSTGASAPKMYL